MSLLPPTPAKVSVCNQHPLPDVLLKESPEDSSPSLHAKWSRNELPHQALDRWQMCEQKECCHYLKHEVLGGFVV